MPVSVPTGVSPADNQAAFAATLVDEWVRGGVTHAVVCPGSRSTPLVRALASHGAMAIHVRLDERSAGFTALGIGRATGRPALVVTTSGTAAAELHASVVEADLSGVPLIACTADRPPERRDVGAPQTIDQWHLFGPSPRWFADPGVPDPAARSSWRSLAARAVAEAVSGPRGPGPVHLNLPFREPLLGDPASGGGIVPGRAGDAPWHRVERAGGLPDPAALDRLVGAGLAHPGRRGLISAGAGCGDPAAVVALGSVLGWPVLAEPRAGLRFPDPGVVAAADGIVRATGFAQAHWPEVVLRLGERWASSAVESFLSTAVQRGTTDIAVDRWGRWRDPDNAAAHVVPADPGLFCRELTALLAGSGAAGQGPPLPDWSASWASAEARAQGVIRSMCGADRSDPGLTEPALAHRLFARMPAEGTLVVSSSMPVRDVEAFAAPRPGPPRVVANRGANGIDGVVSTALGVARASAGPTVALVGDLAFLHDVSALVQGRTAPPLVVVVADNRGGGIFSFLEASAVLDGASFEAYFATPQDSDVAAVAQGFGWTVDDLGEGATSFEEVLDARMEAGRASVIRVRVPGREENVAVHARINAAIAEAVEGRAVASAGQQGRGS